MDLEGDQLKDAVRTILDLDAARLATTTDEWDGLLAVASVIAFGAIVDESLGGADDVTITRAATESTLVDADGKVIPAWIVYAAIRHALGETRAVEGVPPEDLLDAHFSFAWRWAMDNSPDESKREELTQTGVTKFLEAMDRAPKRT